MAKHEHEEHEEHEPKRHRKSHQAPRGGSHDAGGGGVLPGLGKHNTMEGHVGDVGGSMGTTDPVFGSHSSTGESHEGRESEVGEDNED